MDTNQGGSFLSAGARSKEERSLAPWIIAGVVVLLVVAGLVLAASQKKRALSASSHAAPDPYAAQLALSGLTLSQSSNMAGSQLTYVDGNITNNGSRTVDGITVETAFGLASGLGAQKIAGALAFIRSRDPYIDIEPVSADPLRAGQTRPFRLIFDRVSQDWDQQNPSVRIMQLHFR